MEKREIEKVSPMKKPQPHYLDKVGINNILEFARSRKDFLTGEIFEEDSIEFNLSLATDISSVISNIEDYIASKYLMKEKIKEISGYHAELTVCLNKSEKFLNKGFLKDVEDIKGFKANRESVRSSKRKITKARENQLNRFLELSKEKETLYENSVLGDLALKSDVFRTLLAFATNDVNSLIKREKDNVSEVARIIRIKHRIYIKNTFMDGDDPSRDLYGHVKHVKLIKEVNDYIEINSYEVKCRQYKKTVAILKSAGKISFSF